MDTHTLVKTKDGYYNICKEDREKMKAAVEMLRNVVGAHMMDQVEFQQGINSIEEMMDMEYDAEPGDFDGGVYSDVDEAGYPTIFENADLKTFEVSRE